MSQPCKDLQAISTLMDGSEREAFLARWAAAQRHHEAILLVGLCPVPVGAEAVLLNYAAMMEAGEVERLDGPAALRRAAEMVRWPQREKS